MGSIICLIALLIVIIYIISVYNRGVKYRNYVREAFSTMDVYLKKRWDLIPNLIELVKGYSEHEKSLLLKLTETRTGNYDAMSMEEKLQTNEQIGAIIPKIFAVAENYPDLKANQNFIKLMEGYTDIENDIANSRKYYNGTVRELNTFAEIFPSNIICNIFGIKQERLFEINDGERQNIKVEL
ncbi:LemA family protein [bacterium]|nr:LemA family protein [bacterium]